MCMYVPDPPIIIKGGSITIEFDESTLLPAGKGKFHNARKRITRVEITGTGIPNYDVDAVGNDITIKVFYNTNP